MPVKKIVREADMVGIMKKERAAKLTKPVKWGGAM
jgi:hypothetical protein